jgi:hypothetical protein
VVKCPLCNEKQDNLVRILARKIPKIYREENISEINMHFFFVKWRSFGAVLRKIFKALVDNMHISLTKENSDIHALVNVTILH